MPQRWYRKNQRSTLSTRNDSVIMWIVAGEEAVTVAMFHVMEPDPKIETVTLIPHTNKPTNNPNVKNGTNNKLGSCAKTHDA